MAILRDRFEFRIQNRVIEGVLCKAVCRHFSPAINWFPQLPPDTVLSEIEKAEARQFDGNYRFKGA